MDYPDGPNVGRFAPLPVRPKSFRPLEIRLNHFDPNWVKSLEYERKKQLKTSQRQSYHKLDLVLNLLQCFHESRKNVHTSSFCHKRGYMDVTCYKPFESLDVSE